MNSRILRLALLLVALAPLAGPLGCGRKPPPSGEESPLPVNWSYPIEREVTDAVDFTGRLDSPNSVDIRPRVTGYLIKMPFKEGAPVKQDDLLFEIDPSTYKATVDQGTADVNLSSAKYVLAKADNARAKKIQADNPAAISQQDVDKYDAAEKEAKASVEATKAKLESAKIYLGWCKVQAPIDGTISRYYLTVGNLVNQDQTLLTTIVSLDPIYAYFDMDERTLLRVRSAIRDGKIDYDPRTEEFSVYMGLANEEGYPHKGKINFVNNKVDPLTGTITVRGEFANPKGARDLRLMSPGMFVRIHLPITRPYKALLVSQKALVIDQGLKNVFLIDDRDKIQYQRVQPGPPQPDGLQVILEGLTARDRVAVSNLQFVRPDMVVTPEEGKMPTVPIPGQGKREIKPPPRGTKPDKPDEKK